MKKVLEYEGTIPIVCRLAQEPLSYNFTIVHRSNRIMVYVDAVTFNFVHTISHHIYITALLISHNRATRPRAYDATKFRNLGNINITETDNPSINPPPFLTSDVL